MRDDQPITSKSPHQLVTQEDLGGPKFDELPIGGNNVPNPAARDSPGYGGGLIEGDFSGKNFQGYRPDFHNANYYAATNQSAIDLVGNGLAQFASEATLGIGEGVGYLADLKFWTDKIAGNEVEMDNWFSGLMRQAKEGIREATPVHDSPGSEGFAPLNGRWWAKNAGSLGTALSLIVPATGIGGGLAKLATLAKAPKIVSTIASFTGAGISSRYMESLMEANQLFDEAIQNGKTKEVAGDIASNAYRDNMKLFAVDMIQYASLFGGGIGKALQKIGSRSAGKVGGMALAKEAVFQAPVEAAEEAYQFIAGEEAKLIGEGKIAAAEGYTPFGENFSERFGDYLKDEELWTSAFMGAVGGMAMPVVFNKAQKLMGLDRKVDREAEMQALKKLGDVNASKLEKDREFFSVAFRMSAEGRALDFENDIKGQLELAKKENDQEKIEMYDQWLKELPEFETLFNRVMNKGDYSRSGKFEHIKNESSELKSMEIANTWELRERNNTLQAYEKEFTDMEIGSIENGMLDVRFKDVKRLHTLDYMYRHGLMDEAIPNEKTRNARASQIKRELEGEIKKFVELDKLESDPDKKFNLHKADELDKRIELITEIDDQFEANLKRQEQTRNDIKDVKNNLVKMKSAKGRNDLLDKRNEAQTKLLGSYEEMFSQFLGEGVKISNGEDVWDVVSHGDKFILRKEGDPIIPGGSIEPLTDAEYKKYLKTKKASDARLIQIANKKQKDGRSGLTAREKSIYDQNTEKVEAILARNEVRNSGEGFTRRELFAFMGKQEKPMRITDASEYHAKQEQQAVIDDKNFYLDDNKRLKTALRGKTDKYSALKETLTGKIEDARTLRALDKILMEIEKIDRKIQTNNIWIEALNQPTKEDRENFIRRAKKMGLAPMNRVDGKYDYILNDDGTWAVSPASQYYDQKIEELTAEKIELESIVNDVSEVQVSLQEEMTELNKLMSKRKTAKRKTRFAELGKSIEENETRLKTTGERIDVIDKDLEEYNSKLDEVTGESIILKKKELTDMLKGTETRKGLKFLLNETVDKLDELQKVYDNLLELISQTFDVPLAALRKNDDALDKKLRELDLFSDEKFEEFKKQAKQVHNYRERISYLQGKVKSIGSAINQAKKELKEIKGIERIAFPKGRGEKKSKGKNKKTGGKKGDIPPINEPLEPGERFRPKKSADEFFDFLRGSQFPFGIDGKINPDPAAQRYFAWVEDHTMVSTTGKKWPGPYYVQLLRHKVGENKYSPFMSPETHDRLLKSKGQEFMDNIIVAVIVDKKKRPVTLDNLSIKSNDHADWAGTGIYTYFADGSTSGEYGENYRGTPEQMEESKKKFLEKREKIMEQLDLGTEVYLHASSKSVGFPLESERKPAIDTIIEGRDPQVLISTTGQISYQNRPLSTQNGLIYLRDLTSGQVSQAYPRQLNDGEIETVKQLLIEANNQAHMDNPFDYVLPSLNISIRQALEDYIYYGTKGYIYEKRNGKKFTGFVEFQDIGPHKLSDIVKTDKTLTDWISSQFHQVSKSNLSSNKKFNRVVWNGSEFATESFDNYKEYLLRGDQHVLESTLPAYSPKIDQPRKANTNIAYDLNNIGYGDTPNSTKSKVKPRKPQASDPDKSKKVKVRKTKGSSRADQAIADAQKQGFKFDPKTDVDTSKKGKKGGKQQKFKTASKPITKSTGVITQSMLSGKKKKKKKGPSLNDWESGKDRPVGLTKNYTQEDILQAQKWFKERFPQVPLDIAYDLMKSGSWGRFTKHGRVLLDPFAEEGTIYHESFHVTAGLFLDQTQFDKVIDQYRSHVGDKSLTDSQVEEILAEDFREYVMTGEMSSYAPKNFFQKLLNFVQWALGMRPNQIKEVFENIVDGNYAAVQPNYSRLREDKNSFHDKDAQFTKDIVDGVNAMFWRAMPDGDMVTSILEGTLTKGELYNIYDDVLNSVMRSRDRQIEESEGAVAGSIDAVHHANLANARQWAIDNFFTSEEGPSVVDKHFEYLRKFGIELELPDIPTDEIEVGGMDRDNQWAEQAIESSPKLTASSQVKIWLSAIPRHKRNSDELYTNALGFVVMEDFSKVYSILSNKLSGLQDIELMREEVGELAKIMPSMAMVDKYFSLSVEDSQLGLTQESRKTQFYQAFNKHEHIYTRMLVGTNGSTYISSILRGLQAKIYSDWEVNFNSSVTQEVQDSLEGKTPLSVDDAVRQAEAMGLSIPNPELIDNTLFAGAAEKFIDDVKYISNHIIEIGSPFDNDDLQGRMMSLVRLVEALNTDAIEGSHVGLGGKTKFNNSLYAYYSMVGDTLNSLAETIREEGYDQDTAYQLIYAEFPHLEGDLYSANSKVLDDVSKGISFPVHTLEGLDAEFESGTEYDKLREVDLLTSQVENVLNGRYHMLRPADNKLERTFAWGLFMDVTQVDQRKNNVGAPVRMLLDYLKDEMEVIRDANSENPQDYSVWQYLGENLAMEQQNPEDYFHRGGILLSAISHPKTIPAIESYVRGEMTTEQFVEHADVVDQMTKWFQGVTQTVVKGMESAKIYTETNKKVRDNLQDFSIETIAKLFTINYMVGNIEQTKLLTGHPAQYKSVEDFFKRMTGMVGTKTSPRVDENMNNFLRAHMGVTKEQPILRTAVSADVQVYSDYVDSYASHLAKRYSGNPLAAEQAVSVYKDMDEGDASGLISLPAYREFMVRLGQWTYKLEAMYQWETQGGWAGNVVTVPTDNVAEEIAGKTLTRSDIERDGYYFSPLKPQYFGPLVNESHNITAYYKLSLMPMLPSMMVDSKGENRNLKELSDKMTRQKIDVHVFGTGNKVGARYADGIPALPQLYNDEGGISNEPFIPLETDFKYWGIQVQNEPKQKYRVASGTQFLKQIESNLIYQGVPKDYQPDGERVSSWEKLEPPQRVEASPLYKKIVELRKLNRVRQELGVMGLKQRLGLRETVIGEETFYSIDSSKLQGTIDFLKAEFTKRDLPENMIDAVKWIDQGIDTLVNREKVENILMSIADRMTISQKRAGKSSVQVPSTMFEVQGTRKFELEDGKRRYSSNDLKFYDLEYKVDGKKATQEEWEKAGSNSEDVKIGAMEVYLPHYFKELLGQDIDIKTIDKNLLRAIGFRIPTQGLNSIENIIIKDFLPESGGDYVVVPTEIVAKAGSDYDFDKLFLHFPNYEIEEGSPKYIKYSGSSSDVWERRKKRFTKSIPELAQEIQDIHNDFKKEVAEIVFGQDITYTAWASVVVPTFRGILTDSSKSIDNIIKWAETYSSQYNVLLAEGKLTEQERTDVEGQKESLRILLADKEQMLKVLEGNSELIERLKESKEEELEVVYQKAFEIFDNLTIMQKNGTKAVENRMMEIHTDFLEDADRFSEMINPITTSQLKNRAKSLNKLKNIPNELSAMSNIAVPLYVIQKGLDFMMSKQNIGRSALSSTSHILFSQVNAYLNLKKGEFINLPTNSFDNKHSLAGLKDTKGQYYISDILSQMINGYVDATKDPFMFQINAGPDGVNIFSLLIRLGTPLDMVVSFMNQPIVDEYLEEKAKYSSTYLRRANQRDHNYVQTIRDKWAPKDKKGNYKDAWKRMKNASDLNKFIEEYWAGDRQIDALTDNDRAAQIAVLDQFISLEKISEDLRDAVWGISYDTGAGGKNTTEALRRTMLTDRVIDNGRIGNYEKLFVPGEFIEPFRRSVQDILEMFKPLMLHLRNDSAATQFKRMIEVAGSQFNFDGIMNVFKADFMTYLMHTLVDGNNVSMTANRPELIYTNNSAGERNQTVPYTIKTLQDQMKSGAIQPNALIMDMSVHLKNKVPSRTNDPKAKTVYIDNLSLNRGSKVDTFDSNIYTEAWRDIEARFGRYNLAEDLAMFMWMQSGLQNSPINFIGLMPNDMYADFMNVVLERVDKNSNFDNYFHEFFLNNTRGPIWKVVKSSKAINSDYPAWMVTGEFNDKPSFYLYGPDSKKYNRVYPEKIRSVNNLKNQSTQKYYMDLDYSYYTTESNQKTGTKPSQEKNNEIDESFNQLESSAGVKQVAESYNMSSTGFISPASSPALITQDLKKRGLGYVKVKKARTGSYYFSVGNKFYNPFNPSYQLTASSIPADDQLDMVVQRFLDKIGAEVNWVGQLEHDAVARVDAISKVIDIVLANRGIDTLTEEAVHLMVSMMRGSDQYGRMMNAITNFPIYQTVSEEYGKLENYDETKVKEEAVAKLITELVVQQHVDEQSKSLLRVWLEAIIKRLREIFKSDPVADFRKSARNILKGDISGLNDVHSPLDAVDSTFYQIKPNKDRAKYIDDQIKEVNDLDIVNKSGRYFIESLNKWVRFRPTDKVQKYAKSIYGRREFTPEKKKLYTTKGTIIHQYNQILMEHFIAGKTPTQTTVQNLVHKQLKDHPDFEGITNKGYYTLAKDQYKSLLQGTKNLFDSIMEGDKKAKIYTEQVVYNPGSNDAQSIAGTIDVLVRHSDGTLSIFDYKGMNMFFDSRNKTYRQTADKKRQLFDMQLSLYKNILKDAWNLTDADFRQTRVVPINMQFSSKNPDAFWKLEMYGNDPTKEYLRSLSVADELLPKDQNLNIFITQLYEERNRLRATMQNTKGQERDRARLRLDKLNNTLDDLIVSGEIESALKDISEVVNDIKKNISEFTPAKINEYKSFIELYDSFNTAFDKRLKKMKKDAKGDKKATKVYNKLAAKIKAYNNLLDLANNNLDQRMVDIAVEVAEMDKKDLLDGGKVKTGLGYFFEGIADWNNPIIYTIGTILAEQRELVRQRLLSDERDIDKIHEEYVKWARSRGFKGANTFDPLIRKSDRNLITMYNKKFYEDMNEKKISGREKLNAENDLSKAEEVKWFESHYIFDDEKWQAFYDENKKTLEASPFLNKEDVKKELKKLENLNPSKTRGAWFAYRNRFIRPKSESTGVESKYISPEWQFINAKGNEPARKYLEMYYDQIDEMRQAVGYGTMSFNFVANVHANTLEKMGTTGTFGEMSIVGDTKRSLEMRDNDDIFGVVDPNTGEVIDKIPLLYLDTLRGDVTPQEKHDISEDLAGTFDRGTPEHLEAVDTAVAKLAYEKGVRDKSKDLTKSLKLMMENAYDHQYKSEVEDLVLMFRNIMTTDLYKETPTDMFNLPVLNRITGTLQTRVGISATTENAVNKFLKMHLYGRNIQSKDMTTEIGERRYSGTKVIKLLERYLSLKSLAFNPILAGASNIGAQINRRIVGAKGNYYTNQSWKDSMESLTSMNEKDLAAIYYLEPSARDLKLDKAIKKSASGLVRQFNPRTFFALHRGVINKRGSKKWGIDNPIFGDDNVDNGIFLSVMRSWVLDSDGKIKSKQNPQTKLEDAKAKTLYELFEYNEDGNWKIQGLSHKELVRFRRIVHKAQNRVKGSQTEDQNHLANTHIMSAALMKFRQWMPGLIAERGSSFRYNRLTESWEQGHFNTSLQEILPVSNRAYQRMTNAEFEAEAYATTIGTIIGGHIMPTISTFMSFGAELISMGAWKMKPDKRKAEFYWLKHLKENPEIDPETFTLEAYTEFRMRQFRAMATEVRYLLGLSMLLLSALQSLGWDEEEDNILTFNLYKLASRASLELSFFFSIESVNEIVKSPLPVMRLLTDFQKMGKNFIIESSQGLGVTPENKRDKTPYLYYTLKNVPGINQVLTLNAYFNTGKSKSSFEEIFGESERFYDYILSR